MVNPDPPAPIPGIFPLASSFPPAMAVQVLIPTPLQKFTNDEATASVDANSVD